MSHYEKPDKPIKPMKVEEITFTGGKFREGKIYIDREREPVLADDGSQVVFKDDDGNGIKISCICAKENAPIGSCVLVEMDADDDPQSSTFFCDPAGCGTEIEGALCWSEVSTGNIAFAFKFVK